jgi:hypothetical protein
MSCIILLCPVEPCAPLVPLPLKPVSIGTPLHCLSPPGTHSHVYAHAPFIHFGGCRFTQSSLTIFCRSSRVSLVHVIRGFTIDTTRTQPFLIWSHCPLSPGFPGPSICLVSSSCLTPQHTHPLTCNPYIVTIIDLHSKSALPYLRSAHHYIS